MKNNATKEQLITFSKNVLKLYESWFLENFPKIFFPIEEVNYNRGSCYRNELPPHYTEPIKDGVIFSPKIILRNIDYYSP